MLNVGLLDGLLGVAGMITTSDDWDHSRKFPAKLAPVSLEQCLFFSCGFRLLHVGRKSRAFAA